MKIVFIGPFGLQPKATMRTRALHLGKALIARGHQVTMLIPPWDDPDRAGQRWEDEGVSIINVELPIGVPGLFHMILTRTLIAEALKREPDVIHFFKPKAYAGLAHVGLWSLRKLGQHQIRLVLDSDDWEQAWNDVSPYSLLQKRMFTWQEKWGLRHADAVIVTSRAIENLAQPYLRQTPLFYVPNGCSAETMTTFNLTKIHNEPIKLLRQKWQLGEAPLILLYTRFLEFRLERIVAQVQHISQALPEARWLIVGQGLYEEEKRLETLLDEAGLLSYVRFAGWIPYEETPFYFKAADVAVYPYDDTLINQTKCSVKLIDLLTAGVPVVADAVGQNTEYMEDGVSGILPPAENDVAFSKAIVQLLQDSELRHQIGQAAAQRIREKFTWGTLSEEVEVAYGL